MQQGFLKNNEKYYIHFMVTLLLFPTVKNFQNRLIVDDVITKSLTPGFFSIRVLLSYIDNLLCRSFACQPISSYSVVLFHCFTLSVNIFWTFFFFNVLFNLYFFLDF